MAADARTEGWLAGILEGVAPSQPDMLEPLERMRGLQAAYRVLLQSEAERLKQAFGEEDARVVAMQGRLRRNLAAIENLNVEDQLRRIAVPETRENEALVHGRITDERSRGLTGMTVMLTDDAGNDLGVGEAKVDDNGYFAIVLGEELAGRLATEKKRVYLTIRSDKGETTERRAVSQSVAPGAKVTEMIALSKSGANKPR